MRNPNAKNLERIVPGIEGYEPAQSFIGARDSVFQFAAARSAPIRTIRIPRANAEQSLNRFKIWRFRKNCRLTFAVVGKKSSPNKAFLRGLSVLDLRG
jgi:hypothetical protein